MASPQPTVVRNVDEAKLVNLIRQMVRIPSPRLQETALARYLAAYMEGMGLEVHRQEVKVDNAATEQAYGVLRGKGGGPSLLLCGHLDTAVWESDVYRPDLWTVEPYAAEVRDGKIYGNGTVNMKAGIGAALAAIEAVQRTGVSLTGDVMLAGVAVETTGGIGAQQLMESGLRTTYGIVVEPSDFHIINTMVVAVRALIRVEGKAKHAGSHSKVVDPLEKLTKILRALGPQHEQVPMRGWLTYDSNPDLPGYPRLRVVNARMQADFAEAIVDIRTVPGQSETSVTHDLRKLIDALSREDPDLKGTVQVPPNPGFGPRPHTAKVSTDAKIIQTLSSAHQVVFGTPAKIGPEARLGFADDSAHFRAAGIEAVTYGPGLEEPWPMVDEAMRIADILQAAKVLAVTIQRVCGGS
ncbi:MAG: hypothetical protein A3G35_20030 [candidate division NC10 bacterium RIFCSPLOWO2_12_FULL_66_18]|nr:MAG: hypothetical protein A3G35_20030 [candidate division NC10 bacterium RIFCSPLOWO2_12_FULL_66_18]